MTIPEIIASPEIGLLHSIFMQYHAFIQVEIIEPSREFRLV